MTQEEALSIKVGDTIEVKSTGRTDLWTITNITSKHLFICNTIDGRNGPVERFFLVDPSVTLLKKMYDEEML